MMSILGCSADELGHVLKALGFRADRKLIVAAPGSGQAPEAPVAVPAQDDGIVVSEATASPLAPPATEPAIADAPVPGATPETASVVTGLLQPAGAEPAAEQWEEIWRPRRRGRHFEPVRRRDRTAASEEKASEPAPPRFKSRRPKGDGNGRPERRDGRREGPRHRREEQRPRLPMQAAPPPPKGGVDPDSPFAALSSLKAMLDKRKD